MKHTNKLWSVIALLVVISMLASFVLAGCGITDIIKNLETDENNDDETSGDESGEEQSAEMKSEDEVKDLIGDNYLITLKIVGEADGEEDQSFEVTVASNGEYKVWIGGEEGSAIQKDVEGGCYYYFGNDDTQEYDSVSFIPEDREVDLFSYVSYLFFTNTAGVEYTSKTNENFLGRSCTKYVNEISYNVMTVAYSSTETWIVDNATGACLKHSWAVSGMADGEHGSGSASFECTKFEVGNGVADAIIREYTSKIKIMPVVDRLVLAPAGLSADIDLTVNGTLGVAQFDTENSSASFVYTVQGEAADFTAQVDSVIKALYDGGVKYTMDGEQVDSFDSSDVYNKVTMEGSVVISFEAYSSNNSKISVSGVLSGGEASILQIAFEYAQEN